MAKNDRPARQITNASTLSRDRAQDRYASKRRLRTRRSVLRKVFVALGACLAVAAVAVGVYLAGIQSRLNQGVNPELVSALSSSSIREPFYMLLLGTDKSAEREATGDGVWRSDSIMLARIDPKDKHVTLVSIERDTMVDMGEYGEQKINAAYTLGGPAMAVDVVSKFAGVPISHYAEINFDEFVGVVDKIGGIDVNIKIDLKDDLAGLDLKAGEQRIDGAQALALCRARHAYDAYGGGDYYRTANQRMVVGAILKKLLSADPVTLAASINDIAGSVTTDLSLADILSLAGSFQGFDMSRDLYSGLEPTESKYVNGVWYELVKEPEWHDMMERVNKGLSPYSDSSQDFTLDVAGAHTAIKNEGGEVKAADKSADAPKGGRVLVTNGAGVTGLAGTVATTLRGEGYTCETATAATDDVATSSVRYVGDGNRELAERVAKQLGLSAVEADTGYGNAGPDDFEPQVVVLLGKDAA